MKPWRLDDLPAGLRQRIEAAAQHAPGATRTGSKPAVDHRVPGPPPNVEQVACNAPVAAQAPARFDRPVIVGIVERRHRLPDADGSSPKYLVDALVSAGILQDDDRRHVASVDHKTIQAPRSEPETTTIQIVPCA